MQVHPFFVVQILGIIIGKFIFEKQRFIRVRFEKQSGPIYRRIGIMQNA